MDRICCTCTKQIFYFRTVRSVTEKFALVATAFNFTENFVIHDIIFNHKVRIRLERILKL